MDGVISVKKIVTMNESNLELLLKNLDRYDEFWNDRILTDEFENENSEYFVLLDDKDDVIGFAGLWFNFDEAHIMNIAVRDDLRRMGFGTQLLEFVIDIAKQKKKDCITLEVREDNISAINLYKKMNFEEVGRRKRYYNNSADAIIMTIFFEKNN